MLRNELVLQCDSSVPGKLVPGMLVPGKLVPVLMLPAAVPVVAEVGSTASGARAALTGPVLHYRRETHLDLDSMEESS